MNRHFWPWGAAFAFLLGVAPVAVAQEAPALAKHYYNQTSFRIPVVIDDRERVTLAELKLFVRQGAGDWLCKATGPATQKSFSFQSDGDGEYAFSIATVDRAGKMDPPEVRQLKEALVVVVDTQPPEIDVKPATGSAGQVYLQCRLYDTNPDYASIKIQYQQQDGTWKPLEGLSNAPGLIQVPDPRMVDGRIKVRAADKAGNVTEREIDLNSSRVAGPPPPVRSVPPAGLNPAAAPLPKDSSPVVRIAGDGPPMPSSDSVPLPIPGEQPRPATSVSERVPLPISPLPAVDGGPLPPSRPAAIPDPQPKAPEIPFEEPRRDPGQMPIINSTRCRMDFSIEPVLGGIAEVEVWATADNGKSWKVVGTSKDGKSPAVLEFPGDGRYGFAFIVKPLTGLPSGLPKAGEAPDGWLEIDTTRPVAELLGAVPGNGPDAGLLLLNWSAKDANFGPEPIALYYATQPAGPWQPIAERLANTGSHRWPVPKNLGPQLWVRLEAKDRAGNVTRCDTPGAIQLESPRPRVRILNVGPAAQ